MPRPGGVLALDLAGVTGWAYGYPGDDPPSFGIWHLADHNTEGWGAQFVSLENEVTDAVEEHQPHEVWMEAPLDSAMKVYRERRNNQEAAYQQLGLAAACDMACYRAGVMIRRARVNTCRKAVLGNGGIPAAIVKAAVLQYCGRRGWGVPDHNAGDACVIWEWRTSILRQSLLARR